MHHINQSKTKQNKGKRTNVVEILRKSRSQHLPFLQNKGDPRSPAQRMKSKKSQQLIQDQHTKKKTHQSRNLHVQMEYYNQQWIGNPTNSFRDDYSTHQIKFAGNEISGSKEKKKVLKKKSQSGDYLPQTSKIKFAQPKGVITFDGKMVKIPGKKSQRTLNKNYTASNSQFASQEKEEIKKTRIRQNFMTKSKSKSKNKIKQASIGKAVKFFDKKDLRKTMGSVERDFIRKTLLSEDTQVSPPRYEYQRNQFIDFCQIHFLVDQEINDQKEPICIDPALEQIRQGCFKMLSHICGKIPMRKQTFFLSTHIFDRSLDCNITVTNRNYKLLALVSLALALKLQQAQLGVEFMYVLGILNSKKQKSSLRTTLNGKTQPKDLLKPKKPKAQRCIHIPGTNMIRMDSFGQLLSQQKCGKFLMSQFMNLEIEVAVKLEFKLWRCRMIYWCDMLTCFWDQYILAERQEEEVQRILFRSPTSSKNLAFVYQILQLAHTSLRIHLYQPIYVILSIMYLVVRIGLQKNPKGFQHYRNALNKSTGILFVDRTGFNEIFWNYLQRLKVEMGDILNCCQFVSQFLQPLKLDANLLAQPPHKFEARAAYHKYNPDLYDSIWK